MANAVIRVEGVRHLQRAFRLTGLGMEKGINEALEAASEPVRLGAESLADGVLKTPKNVDWTAMRIGVKSQYSYVAPVQRSRGRRSSSRARAQKFKARLLGRAMEPALEGNRDNVIRQFRRELADLWRAWGRL